jgi:hypothetical protein
MARNGSRAVYSLERDHGFTGRNISMGTSIIASTIARDTMGIFRSAANIQQNTGKNFTDKRCMTRMVTKLRATTGKLTQSSDQ